MEDFCRNRLEEIHEAIHELCQPLTALHCRLELGQMMGDRESLKEAVEGGLEEAQRVFAVIARMRTRLRAYDPATTSGSPADHNRAIQ